MIAQFTGPILIVMSALAIATAVVLFFALWNVIKMILWCSPTEANKAHFLIIKHINCKAEESVLTENLKIWVPRQHSLQTLEKHDLQ